MKTSRSQVQRHLDGIARTMINAVSDELSKAEREQAKEILAQVRKLQDMMDK